MNNSRRMTKISVCIICNVLSLVLLVTAFWFPGFAMRKKNDEADKKSAGARSTVKADAENPVAELGDGVAVTLSPFLFDYDEELEVSAEKTGTETTGNGECRVTSYDIGIGDMHELDTYIEIRLPFGDDFCEAGEDPARCVGAKYKNDSTGEWEDVLYAVDDEKKQLVIFTDHLSTYGCFEVKKEGLRNAYVSDIDKYFIDTDIPLDKAAKAMANYAKMGIDGTDVVELGKEIFARTINQMLADTGVVTDGLDVAINGYNGIMAYDLHFFSEGATELNNSLNKTLGNLGKLVGAIKLGEEILKVDKSNEDIIGIYKDAGMYAMSFAEGALGTAMAGVWLLDKSVTDFGKEARGITMENWEKIYVYFNDKWDDHGGSDRARTPKEWRTLITKIIKASHGDQEVFKQLLEAQVDSYAWRFFNNDPEDDIREIETIIDGHWKGSLSRSEKEQLVEKYKKTLLQRLSGVIMVEMQKDSQKKIEAELLQEMNELKKYMNQKSKVHLYEVAEEGQNPSLAGYTYRFGKLGDMAKPDFWTGTLDGNGEADTTMTVIGWLCAGCPNHVEFWAPEKDPDNDKPDFTVPFRFQAPKCDVPVEFQAFPTLDEVVGDYENGIITIVDVQYSNPKTPEKLKKAGCDDPQNAVGETRALPFHFIKAGEDSAKLVIDEEGWDTLGDIILVYDETTGMFESYTLSEKGDSIIFNFSAVYSDPEKSGVVIGCEMKAFSVGGAYDGMTADLNLAGERSLK